MEKPQLESGMAWLLGQIFDEGHNSIKAVITQAGTRGIKLIKTQGINQFNRLYNVDEDDTNKTHTSIMEVMAYLNLTYNTGIEVILDFSLCAILDKTVPITSISTMMLALEKDTTFWVTTDSAQNLPDVSNTNRKQVCVYLKTIEQLEAAQATDLEVERSSAYDINHTGQLMLRAPDLSLILKIYEQVLSEPEKYPFLTSDVTAVLNQIKDEAFDDIQRNIQQN